jgi:cystathionine beta-lyase
MIYNFDQIIPRENTDCVKYDLRKQLFETEDVIPMWVADMDFATPDFILEAISERLKHPILPYSFRGQEYHNSIISWLKSEHSWNIEVSDLSFCPGVVPGLVVAVQALTKPDDKIIVQTPVYFPFFSTIQGSGRKMIINELKEENGVYTMDFENLESQIDDQTKILILCNPHNPVGRVWRREELEKLLAICKKYNLIVISDEIHSDLVFKPFKHIPIASLSEDAANRTITFMAPSKTFNIAGLSTSFVVIQNQTHLKRYNRLLEINHLSMGNIFGTIGSTAAYTYGKDWKNQLVDYLQENLNYVESFLKNYIPKIKLIKTEATYLLWLDCRELGLNDKDLHQFFIQKAKLGFSTGESFGKGGSGFMRMNIACPKSIVEKAMQQMLIINDL